MRLLGNGLLGRLPPVTWLLLDRFTGTEAAPITKPHICDVAGQFDVVDTSNLYSVAGGEMIQSANGATVDPRIVYAVARAGGRAVTIRHQVDASNANAPRFGFTTNPALDNDTYWYGGYHLRRTNPNKYNAPNDLVSTWSNSIYYYYSFVLRAPAGAYIIRNFQDILWETPSYSDATLYFAHISRGLATVRWSLVGARDLGAPWNTQFGIATINETLPANNSAATVGLDAMPAVWFSNPSDWTNAEVGLRFRVQDSQNYLRVRIVGANATQGTLKVERIEGGAVTVTHASAGPLTLTSYSLQALGAMLFSAGSAWMGRWYTSTSQNYGVLGPYTDTSFASATNAECYCNQAFLDAGGVLTQFVSYPRLLPAALRAQLSQGIV